MSELCFGTLGGVDAAALAAALAQGVTAIEVDAGDIAAAERIGAVLQQEGARDRVHILARVRPRVPLDLPSPHLLVRDVYPGATIAAQTEALLTALGVERLAMQQLHAWSPEWLDEGDWREAMRTLRAQGKIAGIGISLFDHDAPAAAPAIASGAVDCVQALFNLFDPSAAALFPLCRTHDVGVIARSPLHYGALAGGVRSYPAQDWRHDYFHADLAREAADRAARIAGDAACDGPLSEAALRFVLTHDTVATVATGMRDVAQVMANVAAVERGPLDIAQITALAAHRWLC